MVKREGEREHLSDHDLTIADNGLLLYPAHPQYGHLRIINCWNESSTTKWSNIGDGESAALEFSNFDASFPGPRGQILDGCRDLHNGLTVSIMNDWNQQPFTSIHRNANVIVVFIDDLLFERIKGGIKSGSGPESGCYCLDNEGQQSKMATRLSLTARSLPHTELFQKGNIGLVHVRHMRHQGHGCNHLVSHFPPDRPKRLFFNRTPLCKVRKRFKIEERDSCAGLGSIRSLGKPLFCGRFVRNLNLCCNRFLRRSYSRFFSEERHVFRSNSAARSGGSN